ncbi:hypothetical protein B0H15DRAFT_949357 [Mycena belliarum]|uniref:Uncharacterized protein n=1 Tax=Mycena belliarum TaxID=1033014 RepID=A0AAD6U4V2_9AGAR|nr:hypothetical protein B0H15DRAFT_949357 [Mycena belliae]
MPHDSDIFVAAVDAPPPPVVVLLGHTNLTPPAPSTLLMHEDIELGPSLAAKKGRVVAFEAPPSPLPTYPPLPRDKIRSTVFATENVSSDSGPKIAPPPGGASRVKKAEFKEITGWSQEFIDNFHQRGLELVKDKLDPSLSLSDQDQAARAEVIAALVNAFPAVNNFESRWPVDYVLINACKSSRVVQKTVHERAVVETAMNLRPKVRQDKSSLCDTLSFSATPPHAMTNGRLGVKQTTKRKPRNISVRFYPTRGPPIQTRLPVLKHPRPTRLRDFIAVDTLLGSHHIQPHVHEIHVGVLLRGGDGRSRTERYKAFYKKHKRLPYHLHLKFQGDLAIVRTSEGEAVNLRPDDQRVTDFIAVS